MKARDVPFGVKFITQDWRLVVRNISIFDSHRINDDLTMNVRPNYVLRKLESDGTSTIVSSVEEMKIITVNKACGPRNVFDYVLADEEIRQIICD